MNKFKLYFIVLITTVSLFSCSKDKQDEIVSIPPRDFTEQYKTEKVLIEKYLTENYIAVIEKPDTTEDQDIIITKIPVGGNQRSILSYYTELESTTFPQLRIREVTRNGVKYDLYYLIVREGVGASPCNADAIFASYKGSYLTESATTPPSEISATLFEEVKFPQQSLSLLGVITGWNQSFPFFKSGNSFNNTDGTVTHTDFGAGVIFIPSGLAYYNQPQGSIPQYATLVFNIKLYDITRNDEDKDGIMSFQETVDNNPFVNEIDTDGDGVPNYIDIDDDGDKTNTSVEIRNPATGKPFPFNDIPTCQPSGNKNYLDASCHP